MPRLRVLSGAEVCAILERQGFTPSRRRGSHAVMQRLTPDGTVTVPVPLHSEIAVGTLMAIIRQSEVPRSLFEVG